MPQEKFGNYAQAETLHSEKRRISRSNFQGEKSGHSIILLCRLRNDVKVVNSFGIGKLTISKIIKRVLFLV